MSRKPYLHRSKDIQNDDIKSEELLQIRDNGKNKSPKKEGRNKANPSAKTELTPSAKLMRKLLGALATIMIIWSLFFSSTVSQNQAAEEIANQSTTEIYSGFVLENASDLAIEAQDFTVGDFDGGTARMLIWDFTGNTEDKIQILVDGQIIRESHTLTSNVAAYSVPVPSVVTIRGLEDQAHYAVKFPERKYTMFNTVAPSGANAYTLTPLIP